MSVSCLDVLKQHLSNPTEAPVIPPQIWNILTVGELVDRLTILENKARIADEVTSVAITDQIGNVCKVIRWSIDGRLTQIDDLLKLAAELHASNRLQWEFENKVRSENPAQAGLWAQKARNQNNKRILLKNQINQLFEQCSEYKRYS